jgi:hypothetical protein
MNGQPTHGDVSALASTARFTTYRRRRLAITSHPSSRHPMHSSIW